MGGLFLMSEEPLKSSHLMSQPPLTRTKTTKGLSCLGCGFNSCVEPKPHVQNSNTNPNPNSPHLQTLNQAQKALGADIITIPLDEPPPLHYYLT